MFVCKGFAIAIGRVNEIPSIVGGLIANCDVADCSLFQIRYFTTFLLLLAAQLCYLAVSSVSQLLALAPGCSPRPELTADIAAVAAPLTRATLGVFGCVVGALTIER